MGGIDAGVAQLLQAIGLLVLGAVIKFAFDRWGAQLGWVREEKKAQDGKIERVDHHARNEIGRIERELGARIRGVDGRVGTVEGDVRVLEERVGNLPTADDMERLNQRLGDVDRGLSGVKSKVDGMDSNVKTILEHILAGERRG